MKNRVQDDLNIRKANQKDFPNILKVINEAAKIYGNKIPRKLYKDPYISIHDLETDVRAGVQFILEEYEDKIVGVMGAQEKDGVLLIRHSYVRPSHQKNGVGSRLLNNYLIGNQGPVLVGCLTSMTWAIGFYQKNGFQILPPELILPVRRKYWALGEAHIRQSVVLGNSKWFELQEKKSLPGKAIPPQTVFNPVEQTDLAIKYASLLYSQITDHKNVRDRWFRYYLLVIGIPIAALLAGVQNNVLRQIFTDPYPVLSAFSILALMIGLLFFMIYIRQRTNYLSVYARVMELENEIISPNLRGVPRTYKFPAMGQFTADFYANGVHIFLNSVWASLAANFTYRSNVTHPKSSSDWIILGGTFIFSLFVHSIIRKRVLTDAEKNLKKGLDHSIE